MYEDQHDVYLEILDRALEAERDKTRAEVELGYLKQTISVIASRNAIAVLTDGQIHHMVDAISQIMLSAAKTPSQMN